MATASPQAGATKSDDQTAATTGRPERPDESTFRSNVEKARKALTDAQEKRKAAQARVNDSRPGNKDSPTAKRQQDLRAQLAEIRTKQQGFKTARNSGQDRIKVLDNQVKAKIAEKKALQEKNTFKSVEDVDREIARLEKEVDTGKMKLVDEKKALAQITSLRKQRRVFASYDEGQKSIDDLKQQISEIRKELDNPEYKSLSDEYTRIQQELDTIKAEQDSAYKDLNSARDTLTEARNVQDQKYADLKKVEDEYYQSLRHYREYEKEANVQREARRKGEREQYLKERKKKDLESRLEQASIPAYLDELKACDALLRLLDPAYVKPSAGSEQSQFAAVAQRTVDETGLKGTRLAKKGDEEEDYFIGSTKKAKKGRKGQAPEPGSTATGKGFGKYFDPQVLTDFELVGVQPPSNSEEHTSIMETLKRKRQDWQQNQEQKTLENIEAAKKEVEQLDNGNGTALPAKASKGSASAKSSVEEATDALQTSTIKEKDAEVAEGTPNGAGDA